MDTSATKMGGKSLAGKLVQRLGLTDHLLTYINSNYAQTLKVKDQLKVSSIICGEVTSTSVRQFTLDEVTEHCHIESCWIALSDKVYDLTEFIASHPGGVEIILENAGTDATVPFESKGHSIDAYKMLQQYCIGELVQKDRRFKT